MSKVDLSIIIPNFNSGNLLDQTLASIFSSDSTYSFEVLIIDNLSEDDPCEIVDKYLKNSIFFLSEADQGIYDAMNKGIKKAKGNWLIFLGAGDTIKMDAISKIEFKSFDFIYGNTRLITSNRIYDGQFDKLKILYKNISHQAIVYNHSLFQLFGNFNTKYHLWADYLFNVEIFFNSSVRICYVDLVLSNFYGSGASDREKDIKFSKNKNRIFLDVLFRNVTIDNLIVFAKFYSRILLIKLKKL